MVEVYCTDVKNQGQADFLLKALKEEFPDYKINFDLEDCDNILRVEGKGMYVPSEEVSAFLENFGFKAKILDDKPSTPHKGRVGLKL